jgi:hypothetical protein
MPVVSIAGFSGIVPRAGSTSLSDNQAQIARNAKLTSGEVRPWRGKTQVYSPTTANLQSVYKFFGPSNQSVWLEWANDVDVAPGPVADVYEYRLYYTSSGFSPKKTNWALATANGGGTAPYPNGYYEMGVPAPTVAPSLNVTASAAHATATITAAQITGLSVGDVLRVTVDGGTPVSLTLTAGSGGAVTATSLSTQIATVTGVTTSVNATNDVVITSNSTLATSTVLVEKKTGTTNNYDPTVVTYTTFVATVNGTTGNPASTSISGTQIASLSPNDVLAVYANSNPAISVTVGAGSGTFPPAVNAQSLATALGSASGITATVVSGSPDTVTVATSITGTSASLQIKKVVPRVDNTYTTVAKSVIATSVTETRAYVYTFVTQLGTVSEESAPSPAATVQASYTGSTVTLSSFDSPPSGNYNFQTKRIYRSVIGSTTSQYQLVAEIPIAQSTYSDTKSVTDLGVVLPSLYYTPPPSTLQGIVALPNGILAGFTGNQVWFCEPYIPHAWPSKYMVTTEYPIVGLGVTNNILFVGTTKNPYLITGSNPGSMMSEKLPLNQPCVSKRSIVGDQYGVIYASPNGLVAVGTGSMDIITQALYTRDEWQALSPSTMVGAIYNNMYFGFYNNGSGRSAIILKRGDTPPLVTFDSDAKVVHVEPQTGTINILSAADNKIYSLDTNASSTVTYQWRSKVFQMPNPMSFAALQVHASYGTGSTLEVKLYCDGTQVFDSVVGSAYPVRVPAIRGYNWEIEVLGDVPVRMVHLATSMAEIRGV